MSDDELYQGDEEQNPEEQGEKTGEEEIEPEEEVNYFWSVFKSLTAVCLHPFIAHKMSFVGFEMSILAKFFR